MKNTNSIVDLIRRYSLDFPDKDALIFIQDLTKPETIRTLSYAQLDTEARRIAIWLQDRFDEGERILLLYPVGIEFVIAFMACLYAGMVAVPAPLPGKQPHHYIRLKNIIYDSASVIIFTASPYLAEISQLFSQDELSKILLFDTDKQDFSEANQWKMPSIDRTTLALLQYTSGSTGNPKGVMISHHNLLSNCDSFRQTLGFTEQTRFGSWLPLYHDMGLMAQLLPALLLGSTYVMMSPTRFLKHPQQWLQMLDQYQIEHTAAPNFAYDLCCQRVSDIEIAKMDLSHVKFMINGSEPVQAKTMEKFAAKFAPAGFHFEAFCPCYGMAEATVFISGYSSRVPVVRQVDPYLLAQHIFKPLEYKKVGYPLVSCGIASGYEIQIVDPVTTKILGPNQIGEIWLRGESISTGYWRNLTATKQNFSAAIEGRQTSYLRTGDLGVLYDGELYITGRIKETIIVNGRNHYPHDIEREVQAQYPEFTNRSGAVFSVVLPDQAEKVVLVHELQWITEVYYLEDMIKRIKNQVLQGFGIHLSAVALLKPGSVMRTTSGKIQRLIMRESFLEQKLATIYEDVDVAIAQLRTAKKDHQNLSIERIL